jgi:Phospholipase/Carboxylesterase
MRLLLSATVLLFGLAACAAGSTTPGGSTASGAPTPTDAAGMFVIRPACATADDGRYLHATGSSGITPVLLLGSGPRGVVVGAQADGGICQVLPYARTLVAKGYHVAVFDWTRPYGDAMTTATRALLDDGAARVVLGGFSRGALVGLGIAESIGPAGVGVFSVSGGPSSSEGFPSIDSLSTYHGPILLVASESDPVFPPGTDAAIAAAHHGHHYGQETVLIVPGSAHALALLDGPDGARIQAAIDDFLTHVLA